jgi:hypothetical protein
VLALLPWRWRSARCSGRRVQRLRGRLLRTQSRAVVALTVSRKKMHCCASPNGLIRSCERFGRTVVAETIPQNNTKESSGCLKMHERTAAPWLRKGPADRSRSRSRANNRHSIVSLLRSQVANNHLTECSTIVHVVLLAKTLSPTARRNHTNPQF